MKPITRGTLRTRCQLASFMTIYQVIDALVTNFHLPESTLIMLVSAFAGYQHTMNAYKVAVEQKYRFFSYGDAMFITYNPQAISERP